MKKIYIYTLLFSFVIIVLFFVFGQPSHNIKAHNVDGYTVLEIDGLLTGEECDTLIQHCITSNAMVNSEVVSKNGNMVVDTHRKSKTVWLEDTEHNVAMKMANKSTALTKYPRTYQEKLQIVCYEPGGKFDAHYDNDYNTDVSTRCATLLVYLNDDYDGGETDFVKIGVSIKPKKGKGILFWSLDEKNQLIKNSMHCGNKVINGKKWICTKWTRIHPYS